MSTSAGGKTVTHQLTRSEANAASKAQVAAKAKARGSAVVPTSAGKQVSQVPTGSVAAGYEQPAGNGSNGLIGVGSAAAAASAAGLGFVLKRRMGAGQAG
ncbi:hypothetical protein EST54_18105 [Streptomyces sioyaensis]|uniref:Uncharacterized protein n=1 Tax=Streptomyces sioyaensis TaxID=67364 RepID=A0A4Q1QZW7_9ACTN|nr:hypothetical protein EST54_18105 [Streptomyces sioyaensis]